MSYLRASSILVVSRSKSLPKLFMVVVGTFDGDFSAVPSSFLFFLDGCCRLRSFSRMQLILWASFSNGSESTETSSLLKSLGDIKHASVDVSRFAPNFEMEIRTRFSSQNRTDLHLQSKLPNQVLINIFTSLLKLTHTWSSEFSSFMSKYFVAEELI